MGESKTAQSEPRSFTSGDRYDVIIIGAGPAGLNAGLHVVHSKKRLSVLLADAIVPWEQPIQCAEAIGRLGFNEAVEVKKAWIRQTITSASFHAPDGTVITYTDKNGGYIIDRAIMQKDLADELNRHGVVLHFNGRVTNIAPPVATGEDGTMLRTVSFSDGSCAQGRIVIDASGPIGCFCKEEGVQAKPPDLEPACFIFAESIDLPDDTVHIYAGSEIAPGGYAWVFPRGKGAANIGVVIGKRFKGKVNIRGLLDTFLAHHFPAIKVVSRFAGAIPCACGRKDPLTAWGLIKTGDAADTVNPVSRAGIAEALLSGGLAGDHALLMCDAANAREMRRIGKAYEKAWFEKRGKNHEKLARVKTSLASVPDRDYIAAAKALSQIPPDELTMSKIFQAALHRFPRLVWALRHLM
jgi:geranylgeranyl reductase family protein